MRTGGGRMLFVALAVVAWGLWGLFGKLALERGMSSHAILVAEGVMGFMGGLLVLGGLQVRRLPLPWQEAWNWYGFLSGAALAGGNGVYYVALRGERVRGAKVRANFRIGSGLAPRKPRKCWARR